jgi:hypothetical protein
MAEEIVISTCKSQFMKSYHRINSLWLYLSLIVIVCTSVNLKCKKDDQRKLILPKHKRTELLVWRKPGVSEAAMAAKRANLKNRYGGDIAVTKKCEGCDQNLEVWSGSTVQNFITEEVAGVSTRPRGKPTGEDDTLYYSLNIIADLPYDKRTQLPTFASGPLPPPPGSNLPVITVAVFDTGADPAVTTNYTQTVSSCKPLGTKGWNFLDENNNVLDNYPGQHGTVVSKFIIDEVRSYATAHPVNILPVKLFGTDGTADLFSILCGFSYARKAGAKIINASFGFYYYLDEPPKMLLKYVEQELTANNVILVAASGNSFPDEEAEATSVLGIAGDDLRNLEKHYFYPGGLSKYLPNVICVTTVSTTLGSSAPNQNYSPVVVNVGAAANVAGTYNFTHPFQPAASVIGSSFATPVFTGELCALYGRVVSLPVNKDAILTNMRTAGIVFDDVPPLSTRVQLGRYVKR